MAQQNRMTPAPAQKLAPDPYLDLAPFVPSASDPWDERKAAHLMRRAGFGARPEDIPGLVQNGMNKCVDQLLAVSPTGLQESGTVQLRNGEQAILSRRYGSRPQWLDEMVNTQYPLKEKMALFWSDHFSVGTKTYEQEALLVRHINVFRRHGLGRWRDLIVDVTKDPAMLWWLDNNVNGQPENGKPKLNENYGRELLELFTLGVHAGYTQDDVREGSKCLSGWSTGAIDQFVYKPNWHIPGNKKVLGRTIFSNGQREVYDMVDAILAHPAAATFLVTKIWKYFVSEDPYSRLVEVLAAKWRASGYDIKFLMSTIFRSRYFYSSRAIKKLVKNPYEFVVQALLASNTTWRYYRYLDTRLVQMGYRLMEYSDPSGYDDGIAWIDEIAMLSRANFGNDLTRYGYYSLFDPNREITRLSLNSARAVVDHYLRIFGVDDIPPGPRNVLYLFMDLIDSGYQQFTFTPSKIDEKVRGLVHLIVSLPEASIN